MKRLVLFALAAASAVLFAACASTEPEKKKEPELPKEDPVIAKAKAEGFALTEEDLTELAKAGKNDLSDDDLENVSGGALSYKVSFACPKCGKKIKTTEGCPNCKTGIYACL